LAISKLLLPISPYLTFKHIVEEKLKSCEGRLEQHADSVSSEETTHPLFLKHVLDGLWDTFLYVGWLQPCLLDDSEPLKGVGCSSGDHPAKHACK
jgi:hypothetical protein